jgi:hypothetical protein
MLGMQFKLGRLLKRKQKLLDKFIGVVEDLENTNNLLLEVESKALNKVNYYECIINNTNEQIKTNTKVINNFKKLLEVE